MMVIYDDVYYYYYFILLILRVKVTVSDRGWWCFGGIQSHRGYVYHGGKMRSKK